MEGNVFSLQRLAYNSVSQESKLSSCRVHIVISEVGKLTAQHIVRTQIQYRPCQPPRYDFLSLSPHFFHLYLFFHSLLYVLQHRKIKTIDLKHRGETNKPTPPVV